MIKKWLIKYWWVNESGKIAVGFGFGTISHILYISGQMIGAFLSGIMFVACAICFIDFLVVVIRKITGKASL